MAWSVTFNQDTDKKGVGTLTAVSDDGVIHARRVDTTASKDVDTFTVEAQAKADAVAAKKQELGTVADAVAAKLNAAKDAGIEVKP